MHPLVGDADDKGGCARAEVGGYTGNHSTFPQFCCDQDYTALKKIIIIKKYNKLNKLKKIFLRLSFIYDREK